MGKSLSKYIFENVEQEPVFENSEISEMRKIIQTEGPTGLARHIDIKYKSWKEEPIKFGIAGKPNTGKSSFINAILNVKDDDEGVDQVDSCESITTPRKYCHPIEKQLLFFELPGIGSENWKKCEYVSKTQLWEYDYFFIVFDTVLYEDDLWLAQQLVKMKKPFVLVRSKVDRDIERGCGEDVSCILKKLREGTFSTINKIEVLQANIGVCFISSVNEDIGEMEKLKNHIILNLKSKKYETILYALNGLSKEIIKTKYILLKRRILVVTAAVTSVSAINLSGIEVGVNISILAREMYYYINELGLCRKERESLINVDDRQVKCRELLKTNCKLVRYILQQSPKLVAVIAVAVLQYKFEIFGPIVGVLISSLLSGPIAYNFLTNILENLTQDSIIGYDHVVSRHVPRKTSIHALLQLPDETTEASQAQASQENSDEAIMREINRNEGHSGVVRYIEDNIDKWKEEPVKFGITGHAATGKSSFVNLMRDVKEGDEGYAQVGEGDTTRSPTSYFHPDNKQIVYWDLPGIGTLDFPKENYVDQMKLQEYDYFFLFFDTVLHEDDLWVAQQLIRMRKSFCLVRSKVDKDVEKGIKQGIDEKTVLANLRKKTLQSINKHKNLKAHCNIFFISCEKRGVGEIDILFQHIRENLSFIKFEAVMYSLHTLSQEVVEEKYKSLKRRVIRASLGTALIAASPIPGVDLVANISILANEIKHYINVFGLTGKQIRKVSYRDQKQLRCKELFGLRSEKMILDIVKTMFIQKYYFLLAALTVSDIFLPIVGSVVSGATTATIVNKLLNDILENLKHDAIFVYDIILPLPIRSIRILREKFENEGQQGINKYIFDVLNRWKEETVILGVIGESNTGKIEFLNLIRHLKIGNPGFAKENKVITPYYHPNNEGIVLIETQLSDFEGTILARSSNEMQITCYDNFFVFLNGDIYTDDMWILHNLVEIEKSFSVIRTKSAPRKRDQETILGTGLAWLNLETDLEILVEKDEEIDSDRLRDIICSHLFKDNEDQYDIHSNVCFLSCLNIGIGEIGELINHTIQNLPSAKSEAVLNALHPSSKEVIEEKFQSLKNRILFVTTAAASTTALQIPSFDFPVNIHILVDEITHYIKVFGFSDKNKDPHVNTDAEVNKLRCRELLEPGVVFSDIIIKQIKVLSTDDNIAAIENIADLFVPVVGSVVSTANNAAIVYKCLTGFLDDFRHDALVVYDRVLAEPE